MGADAAYRRWLQAGLQPHFIGYYALVMGLQGRPWNDCRGKEKTDLRARFDALKAEVKANPSRARTDKALEARLDEIGLRPGPVVRRSRI